MKNFSKAVGIGLAVALVVLAVFAGAGAATFSFNSNNYKLSSDEMVVPGQSITASVTFELNLTNLLVSDTILVKSDLEIPWEATMIVSTSDIENHSVPNISNKYPSVKGMDLSYLGDKATVTVSLTSTVPSSKRGMAITPLTVIVDSPKSYESGTAKTATVSVYDPNKLSGDIAELEQNVSVLTNRIAVYKGYNLISSTVPETCLNEVKSYLAEASKASTDIAKAKAVIEAEKSYTTAVNAVNDAGLKGIKYYLDESAKMINSLKGMNRDVLNLQTLYESYYSSYTNYNSQSNVNRDPAKIDELLQKSYDLTVTANQELYNAEHPMEGLLKILPYIIIGVVGAGVIVLIIILIIRRRKNSWDELG